MLNLVLTKVLLTRLLAVGFPIYFPTQRDAIFNFHGTEYYA